MTSELARVLRALRDGNLRSVTLAWFLDRTGDWLALITLLTGAAESSTDASVIAWTFTAWIVPRMVIGVLYASIGERLGHRAWPALALAKALGIGVAVALIFTPLFPRPIEWLIGLAAVLGFVAALSAEARAAMVRRSFGLERSGQASVATSFADRAAVLVGGIVAAVISYLAPIALALGVATVAFALVALFVYRVAPGAEPPRPVRGEEPDPRETARQTVVWLVAAFTSGAVAAALLIGSFTFFIAVADTRTESIGALLVAAAGLGMVIGPLPVSRLLLRLPAALLLLGLVVLVAVGAIAVLVTHSFAIALVVLAVFGLSAVTLDRLRSIALRRVAPPGLSSRLTRLSVLATTAGQLFGAVGIVSTAGREPFAVVAVLASAQALLLLLGIARAGRGPFRVGSLSPLPVKSVVHRLSWDTRPAARPPDLQAAGARAQRLTKWINRTVSLEQLSATLPISGREYAVFRPDEASRERLFEQGRADPDKQMPYWAKVWPSGVALADVVVERRLEVAGRQVLELGAGLGVTASAVLEYGGELVTADYSALPLAHCRLTTLVNTGKAPEATCFNWRHDSEIAAVLAQPRFAGGFPLIIGGDLLYEGRDAEPLLNVIERMLTPEGQLWLAEPVRRTAQRFLDSAVEHGWEIESRQVRAAWPDATDGPVNLHFLRRSSEPDQIAYDLGGWRT